MEMTLNLAENNINISFLGQAKKAIPLCQYYFSDFLHLELNNGARIKVSILSNNHREFPFRSSIGYPVIEQLLPAQEVAAWLSHIPEYGQDFAVNEASICAHCHDGLLLFDSNTAAGHILLLNQGRACFRPLHRLFWMYFAQVLGEKNCCFIHCAALAKNHSGYLFWGDSGAGKSTVANLSSQGTVISDDSPIFVKENGDYFVYPSPFHQLEHKKNLAKKAETHRTRVKALYFLVKDERLYLENISTRKAFSMILQQHIHFFPYLTVKAKSALFDVFFDACKTIPTYYLHFGRNQDVWEVIRDG
jgi:hypothetical protein